MARASSRPPRPRSPRRRPASRASGLWRYAAVIVLVGAGYWYQEKYLGGAGTMEAPFAQPVPEARAGAEKANGYDKLDGCRVDGHRGNDGDSFMVRHGDAVFELRLYYVDAAETYLSDRHESQRRRVADQGRAFGGLSPEQTVALGQEAKRHVADLLRESEFTVYTKWERVFDSDRFYGFVELPGGGGWLCENLVAAGLARIHTKGEALPDGTAFRQHRSRLESLEREAKAARRGAWRLSPPAAGAKGFDRGAGPCLAKGLTLSARRPDRVKRAA